MKEQSTTRGFAILSAATMMVKILSLLYIPFLRLIIGDEGYGIYGASYQVYAFVFVLTNSGIPVAISKLISELTAVRNYKDAVKGFKIARFILLAIGILMASLLLIFAEPLARAVHYNKAYLPILTLAPAVLFTSIASAYRGYFQGRGNMTPTAVSQVIEQVTNTVFGLIFALYLLKYGVEASYAGPPIGTSLGALASATFLIFYYERNKTFRVPKGYLNEDNRRLTTKALVRRIIKYGIPITVSVGMTYAGNIVDLYNTKVRLMAGGVPEVQATILYGFLTKYQQLLNVPIAIISSLSMAILPAISAAVAVGDRDRVKGNINYSLKLCFLIAVPCAVGLAVLSDPVFQMLKFGGGSYIMAYGSIVLILMSVMQIQTTILQSIGKLYTATLYSVLGIVCKIIANYFLIAIPSVNILGAVGGSVIGFAIPIILNHRIIIKSLGVRLGLLRHSVKPVIASAIMAAIIFIVRYEICGFLGLVTKGYVVNVILTTVSIIIGMLAYLVALMITGGIRKEDLETMPRKLVRLIPGFVMKRIR
ncbi:polysaccharide biosynthesis protein [Clostridium sp. A1-XYC3]|uniref:Polysaccharide biosynthesis protein n=1 Tax=Clostridium tanneri TaxID=3037988 RepID=A0ABU4JXV6_9CLOT|nr:polysaccharide biosynthesis protein [Clostridium sp. A1-XYC3]MDW8802947.1 polysaccharide biosynthesis protein [Clostridium sp. A1-XYC3]